MGSGKREVRYLSYAMGAFSYPKPLMEDMIHNFTEFLSLYLSLLF